MRALFCDPERRARMNWLFLVILGILSLVAGTVALFNPFEASIVATSLAGWLFVFMGVLQIVGAVQADGWAGRIFGVLLGVVALFVGLNVIGEPLTAMLTLTLVVGILFVASGIVKLFMGFTVVGNLRWAVLLSAAASLILGAMVLTNFPQSAVVLLGVLLAVELLSNGVALIAIGWFARGLKKAIAGGAEEPDAAV
jgi:uncharacterized membrane protein HdeD (DUF308 family)